MNSFYKLIANLIKESESFSGHSTFRLADPKAVGENPIREYTLDAVPLDGDQVMVTLSQDGGEKAFEKTLSSKEANHIFSLISSDLAEAVSLTSTQNYEAAKASVKKVLENYAERTDTPVDTNLPKLHNTQAAQKCERCEDIRSEEDPSHEYDPDCAGSLCSKHEKEYLDQKKASQDDKLWRQAKISLTNVFPSGTKQEITFESAEELNAYQGKQKGKIDQDHIPLWDAQKGKETPKDGLAPASLSYEDIENEKERDHEDMQKHIDEKIKTELESALQEKAASVFGPDQVELVQVLRKNGRNWDEIKKILVKDFGFDKDSTNIFVDEQRQGTDPTGIEVEPVKEKPEDKKPLTPPEELVSPETHEKLLQDHEDKKKVNPAVEDKALEFTPKDIMNIPEDDEIEDKSSLLNNEIARADNDEIHKVASEKCKCGHGKLIHGITKDWVPEMSVCGTEKCKCNKFKKASLKTAAPSDLNPLQEPLTEKPTTPSQDVVPMNKPLDHNAPQKGDRVFVSSDLTDEKAGFEATFISTYKSKGTDFSIVETDQGDLLDIESHRVVKTSGPSGTQEADPAAEPQIEMQKSDEIPVSQSTEKLTSLVSSEQDPLLAIQKEAEALLKEMDDMSKTSYMFIRKGLEKHANDSAFEGNGWCRVWVQEDELESDTRYPEILKLADEETRIIALKGLARDLAHQALRLADSAGAKVGVQSWFDSLTPSDHDRIDWVRLATPQAAESSQEPAIEKKAEGSVMDTKCEDCGKPLGPEAFLSKWPVCGACTKKKHKKVTQSSDFEKGISQNKTSDNDMAKTEPKECPYCGKDKEMFSHEFCRPGSKGEKTAAEPEVAPKILFKDYKKTPNYVPKEQAVPATPEMDDVLTKIDSLQSNLATLEAARKQIQVKMQEELTKIDDQGERAQIEAALQESIEKAGVLISAMDNKVVQWKDKLFTLQTEEIQYVPKLTPKEMLSKIYTKFEGAEKYVQDVLNGMLSQGKNVLEKTLIRWPNKKSSANKEASIVDDINHYNDELLAALKELSSPL